MKISNRTVFTFNTKWIGWTTGSGQLQDQRNLGQFSRQLGQHIAPFAFADSCTSHIFSQSIYNPLDCVTCGD